MPMVTYIESGGRVHQVDVPLGLSVMEGALRFAIPGIEGDCGGAGACATCHVYVEGAWGERLAPPDALETAMLATAFDTRLNSRLGCQIEVDETLDGLVVRLPERQY